MTRTMSDSVFYHIYALGAFGAPRLNDGASEPVPRLRRAVDWIPAMERVGANTMLLGPVFESETHGYDTIDYARVDRRLGTKADLAALSGALSARGMGLYLDAVLNHIGRGHPFVRDVARNGERSPYAGWISGYAPAPSSSVPTGMPFRYDGWKGHYDLVRLDTAKPEVRDYLIGVVLGWIDEFDLAGLRLDAADCLDRGFMVELGKRCHEMRPGFALVGEVVHGDHYETILREGGLDAVTDYEAYKGLWSSYNDRNCHEIAWTLDRLFGEPDSGRPAGLCRGRILYSFADNHDVDRVASVLRDGVGLYPLYALLFAMPGAPSVYYGSEFGVDGRKTGCDDGPLRPELDPMAMAGAAPHPDLAAAIGRFAAARSSSRALREGSYRRLAVASESLAFERTCGCERVIVAVNMGTELARLDLPMRTEGTFVDLLEPGYARAPEGGRLRLDVPPHWTRWMRLS